MLLFNLNCTNCQSGNTSVELETAYDRRCEDCDTVFDIRPPEVIEDDLLHTFIN